MTPIYNIFGKNGNKWNKFPFFDCHAHTCDLSYCCNKRITVKTYAQILNRRKDCSGLAITNHGFSIYFPDDLAWSFEYMIHPELWDDHCDWGNQRLNTHLDEIDKYRGQGIFNGVEVEMMIDGRLTLDDSFRDRLDVIIGGVHVLPEKLRNSQLSGDRLFSAWWEHTQQLAASGINILAHPFRWLSKQNGMQINNDLIQEVVWLAKRCDIALELNTHQKISTDIEMLKMCIAEGVLVSIGTDAHRRDEILNFSGHRKILSKTGISPHQIKFWRPD